MPVVVQAVDCDKTLKGIYPAWDDAPWSCRGRCADQYTGQLCACDSYCRVYGDCCADMTDVCPARGNVDSADNDTDRPVNPTAEMVRHDFGRARLVSVCPGNPPLSRDRSVMYGGKNITGLTALKRCGAPWEKLTKTDVLQLMPVTDSNSGHHFSNIYCLLCHGGQLEHVLPWAVAFIWDAKKTRSSRPQDVIQMLQLAAKFGVPTVALPPEGVFARRYLPLDVFFKPRCDCPKLDSLCLNGPEAYMYGGMYPFRNQFCLLCYFLHRDSVPQTIMPVDIESLVLKKNTFHFSLLMRWSRAPADQTEATIQLNTDARDKMSFAWRSMICDVHSADIVLPHNMEMEEEGDEQDTLLEPGTDEAAHSLSVTPKSNSVIPNTSAEVTCQQSDCTPAKPMIDGVCRADYHSTIFNMQMICVKEGSQGDAVIPADTEKVAVAVPEADKALNESLRKNLLAEDGNVIVMEPEVRRTKDKCFWNITARVIFSNSSPLMQNRSQQESVMYRASVQALQESLRDVTGQLHVCVRSLDIQMFQSNVRPISNKACSLSDTLQLQVASSASADPVAGCNAPRVSHVICCIAITAVRVCKTLLD
nr:hypothetical protein BaRGS_011993 [Batillaria attramentaria]